MLLGRRWKNSWRRKAISVASALSPKSCCMRRKSCVGLRSPRSTSLSNCWSLRCSEAAVRLTNCLQDSIRCLHRWLQNQVTDFSRNFWGERSHDVVKFRLLRGDTACGKLCFHLREPHFRVAGPKRRKFEIDGRNDPPWRLLHRLPCLSTSGSPCGAQNTNEIPYTS